VETAQEGAARAPEDGPEEPGTAADAKTPRRRVGILLAVAAGVYALDVLSKLLVVAKLTPGKPVRVIGSLVQLDYTRNSGAAFSIGWGYTAVFSLIAIGVILVILRLARKLYSAPWALALGLLLGGAIGNLTDRIARAPGPFRGWVVDFVQVPRFAIFNLADAAITCGGVLMVLLAFRGLHPDGTDERAELEADRAKEREDAAQEQDQDQDRQHAEHEAAARQQDAPEAEQAELDTESETAQEHR
jgi:signal peptidase II